MAALLDRPTPPSPHPLADRGKLGLIVSFSLVTLISDTCYALMAVAALSEMSLKPALPGRVQRYEYSCQV